MRRAACLLGLVTACLLGAATPVTAQQYPTKPVRIVTAETGSANDLVARIVAQGLTAGFGHQVIVDNRGGVAIEIAARAPADGYTLLFYGSAVWTSPFMRDNLPWDPIRDFVAITSAVSSPNVLVVHPAVAAKSAGELIALAKAKPGQLNYGAGTIGASPHLTAELFKAMTGVNILRVPFKGTGPAVTGLIGGQVHLMFAGSGSVSTHTKSGRLRALAVTSLQPSALMPGVPVLANDIPGFEAASMMGFFAPAKLSPAMLQLLHREMVRVLRLPDVADRLFAAGVEVIGSSPEEFTAKVKAEMQKWGKLIKDTRLREEL